MKLRVLPPAAAALIATVVLAWPHAANAQGNGRPKTRPTAAPTSTAASAASTPVTTYPQFGSWLDDASAPTRGQGSLSIGVGHWRLAGMTQTNVPMIGAGVGLTDRFQVSASVPFYRATAPTWSERGLDDVYVSGKYTLLDPTLTVSEVGLAVSPVVEVLSADTSDGRVHFALPVSIEVRRAPFRVYGSGGYFTRGSVFGGGAVEWTAQNGMSVTGSVMQSYSVKSPADATAIALGRQHADATIGVATPIARSATIYGSVGRSLTSIETGGASLAITGGIALHFSAASSTP